MYTSSASKSEDVGFQNTLRENNIYMFEKLAMKGRTSAFYN
jgi:hypothetical protein